MIIDNADIAQARARLDAEARSAANARSLREVLMAAGGEPAAEAPDDALKTSAGQGAWDEGLRDALLALRDPLADADGQRPSGGRADLDAAVRWHGARVDDLHACL